MNLPALSTWLGIIGYSWGVAVAITWLGTAIAKLVAEHGPEKRLDELIARSRDQKLTPEEQLEFQALLRRRRPGRDHPARLETNCRGPHLTGHPHV